MNKEDFPRRDVFLIFLEERAVMNPDPQLHTPFLKIIL